MATLDILVYPDPRLRRVARRVDRVDDVVRCLIDDMADTMYAAPGVGLAAVQVGVAEQIIVIDTSETRTELQVLINPEILESHGEIETEEGCLSVPGVYAPVIRAESIRLQALDRTGACFELETQGLPAVCIQHEMDHLQGKVFVDYLSRLKQERIRKKLGREFKRSRAESRSESAVAL